MRVPPSAEAPRRREVGMLFYHTWREGVKEHISRWIVHVLLGGGAPLGHGAGWLLRPGLVQGRWFVFLKEKQENVKALGLSVHRVRETP